MATRGYSFLGTATESSGVDELQLEEPIGN